LVFAFLFTNFLGLTPRPFTCDATYCQIVTFIWIKRGFLSFLCDLCASTRACLSFLWAKGRRTNKAKSSQAIGVRFFDYQFPRTPRDPSAFH
jgi:hypothetical protein